MHLQQHSGRPTHRTVVYPSVHAPSASAWLQPASGNSKNPVLRLRTMGQADGSVAGMACSPDSRQLGQGSGKSGNQTDECSPPPT